MLSLRLVVVVTYQTWEQTVLLPTLGGIGERSASHELAEHLTSNPGRYWFARFAGRRGRLSGDGKGYERSVAEPQECGVRASAPRKLAVAAC